MKPNAPHSQGDAQEFLDDVFERAVRLIEEGRPTIADELLDGRENLRAEVERLIRLASQIASGPICRMPVIGGYDVLHELGHGGMGTVYLARQESLGGRPVALKVLPVSTGLSPRARDRFTFEARAIARLRHPNIVAIHDVLDEDGLCAYAMEWIDGTSLAAWIEERKNGSKLESCVPLDVAGICRLGISIARALAAVHNSGILHRDVKPSNILLRRDGTALLADFGLAREVDSSIHTQEGRFAGTVAYAPPEQLRGDTARVDARSDVYALGVTMYHALALRLPFEAREPVAMLRQIESGLSTPLRKLNPRVPRDLETIIAKAIDPDPTRRYQTALEFAEDLERLLGFQPIHARRAGLATRCVKLLRRNRAAAFGMAFGGLIALGLAAALVAYVFFLPGWVAGHVREARLTLLHPGQANNIVSTLYWGRISPGGAEAWDARRQVLRQALVHYDRALRLAPFDQAIRAERAVVERASRKERESGQGATKSQNHETTKPWSNNLRSAGLFAFFIHDYSTAIEKWSAWAQTRDPLTEPDPLVDAALGVLYLFDDQPGRAYPRLQKAAEAFPGVGFILEYLADAAVKCGDVERAERWLQEAQRLRTSAGGGANNRIRAAILARQGRDDEAEAIYRSVTTPGPVILEHARFLESRGRMEEAMVQYSRAAQFMPGFRLNRIFVDAADRWWSGLTARQRLKKIRAALDKSPFEPDSFAALLRQYQTATGSLVRESFLAPTPAGIPSRELATRERIPSTGGAEKGLSAQRPISFSPSALFLSSLFMTLTQSFSSPSLQSLSLSELAERMEVEDMSLWNRIASYPQFIKDLNRAAWHCQLFQPVARSINFATCRFKNVAAKFQNRNMRRSAVLLSAIALGFASSQPADGQCTTPPCFQGLGDLPGGASSSSAFSLSADGTTVVGESQSASGTEAFRWRSVEGIVSAGELAGGSFYSRAEDVSADGSIVAGSSSSQNSGAFPQLEGFRWSSVTGPVGIGDLSGGGFSSTSRGISDDGGIIVGFSAGNLPPAQPFRWTEASGMQQLPLPGGWSGIAMTVSGDGSTAFGFASAGNPNISAHLVRWTTPTTFEDLGAFPDESHAAIPFRCSTNGQNVVGYACSATCTPFEWKNAVGFTALQVLTGATNGRALAITNDASLVSGYCETAGVQQAVIWGPTRVVEPVADVLMQNGISVPAGWSLLTSEDIVVNGNVVTICGSGTNPQGNPEAWIARYASPPPCEGAQVSQHPQNANPAMGATVNLSVVATGTAPLSYQWRKNNVNLNNGASGCSSTISGATTATLTITNVSTTDNATYDCVVTNACGSDTSDPATLTVPPGPACAGDMNGDNVVNGNDIQAFVDKLLTGGSCS